MQHKELESLADYIPNVSVQSEFIATIHRSKHKGYDEKIITLSTVKTFHLWRTKGVPLTPLSHTLHPLTEPGYGPAGTASLPPV